MYDMSSIVMDHHAGLKIYSSVSKEIKKNIYHLLVYIENSVDIIYSYVFSEIKDNV